MSDVDRYGIRRPDTDLGYRISLYDDLMRAVRDLPAEIERDRRIIAGQSRALAAHRREYVYATSTLAWMREHQGAEIATVEAGREAVRARLREAGWNR